MTKLINYRCPRCNKEEEFILCSADEKEIITKCSICKTELVKFNFKNNKSRVYIQDPMGK